MAYGKRQIPLWLSLNITKRLLLSPLSLNFSLSSLCFDFSRDPPPRLSLAFLRCRTLRFPTVGAYGQLKQFAVWRRDFAVVGASL